MLSMIPVEPRPTKGLGEKGWFLLFLVQHRYIVEEFDAIACFGMTGTKACCTLSYRLNKATDSLNFLGPCILWPRLAKPSV